MLILEPDGTITHASALPHGEPAEELSSASSRGAAAAEPALRYEFDVLGLGTVALCIGDETATATVHAPHRFTALSLR